MHYFVYLMASRKNGVLYCGVTSDLPGRVAKHKSGETGGFTKKYRVRRLVWFERHRDIEQAIMREKRIKRWRRDWKIALIEERNPNWDELFLSLF
mgnify:CR=1 FL=1